MECPVGCIRVRWAWEGQRGFVDRGNMNKMTKIIIIML